MIIPSSRVLAALTAVVSAYGCNGARAITPPPSAPISAAPTAPVGLPADPRPDDDASRGTFSISQDIRVACGVVDDDAQSDFDSAQIVGRDRRMLRTLADCLQAGPLMGVK
jgi:hypothetical protein